MSVNNLIDLPIAWVAWPKKANAKTAQNVVVVMSNPTSAASSYKGSWKKKTKNVKILCKYFFLVEHPPSLIPQVSWLARGEGKEVCQSLLMRYSSFVFRTIVTRSVPIANWGQRPAELEDLLLSISVSTMAHFIVIFALLNEEIHFRITSAASSLT